MRTISVSYQASPSPTPAYCVSPRPLTRECYRSASRLHAGWRWTGQHRQESGSINYKTAAIGAVRLLPTHRARPNARGVVGVCGGMREASTADVPGVIRDARGVIHGRGPRPWAGLTGDAPS